MVDWKEHDHKVINSHALADPNYLNAPRNCGILKFFLTLGHWAQPELLQYLINLWDINQEISMIWD